MANEHSSDRAQAEQKLQQDKQAYMQQLRTEGQIQEGSPEWDAKLDAWMEEHQKALREQFAHEPRKMGEGSDEEVLEGRQRKPAEINQPSADHVRSGERAMAKLDEYEQKIKDAKSSKKLSKREQDDLQKLQEKQQLAKDADRKQQEIAHLRWKHEDGSLTQAECMELEQHPEHTNIGSGHGNPV